MVERRLHTSCVRGSSPLIIIKCPFSQVVKTLPFHGKSTSSILVKDILYFIKTESSIVWFNAPVLGTGDHKFESYFSDNYNNSLNLMVE